MRFGGKIAVVTGAAQGIGFACAQRFTEEGAHVVLVDNADNLGSSAARRLTKQGGAATFAQADVSSRDEVVRVIGEIANRFGSIDVLVNNAGISVATNFLDITESEFDHLMAVNLKSVLFSSQAAASVMIRTKTPGCIINLSSVAALLSTPTQAAYAATKGAINALTKAMSIAFAEHGIRVNAVGPGTISTGMTRGLMTGSEADKHAVLSRIPLRRIGEPKDIAGIVSFLASQDAAYMTGQILYAEGGRLSLNFTVPVDE